MRNRIYLEKTSGSTVVIKEYTTRDLIPVKHILSNCSRDAVNIYVKWDQYGRKRQPVAEVLGAKIFNTFLNIVVSRLMESDRLLLGEGKSMFIGQLRKNSEKVGKLRKKNQFYFSTLSVKRGVVLHGTKHEYYFRMPFRRRKELMLRIKKGQNFYNQKD